VMLTDSLMFIYTLLFLSFGSALISTNFFKTFLQVQFIKMIRSDIYIVTKNMLFFNFPFKS